MQFWERSHKLALNLVLASLSIMIFETVECRYFRGSYKPYVCAALMSDNALFRKFDTYPKTSRLSKKYVLLGKELSILKAGSRNFISDVYTISSRDRPYQNLCD